MFCLSILFILSDSNIHVCALELRTLPQEILPLLEQYNKLVLWFGNNPNGLVATRQFSKKLHAERCYMIKFVLLYLLYKNSRICFVRKFHYRTTDERPYEFKKTNQDANFTATLKTAEPILHDSITTFSKLRPEVWAEITNTDSVSESIHWCIEFFFTKYFMIQ